MIKVFAGYGARTHSQGDILDAVIINPVVTEELNGIYELEFTLPIFSSDLIEKENLIMCDTPKFDEQLFRISYIRKEMGMYHVKAYHIFHDLINYLIEDTNIVNAGAGTALNKILNGSADSHTFTATTDLSGKTASARLVRKNIVEAILGTENNSFVNLWGGMIERNNRNIFMRSLPEPANVVRYPHIAYAKNLTGYESEIDYTQVVTKIMPKGFDEVLLPERYVKSSRSGDYPTVKTRVIEYPDVKIKQEGDSEGLTQEEAYNKLRELARQEFEVNEIDLPKATYTVNFVELSRTEEYKDIQQLERIYIGDIVKVSHIKENIDISTRVIGYKYNPLTHQYIEITLGNKIENFTSITAQIKELTNKVDTDVATALELAKSNATDLINKGFGGHVRIHPDRVLIMDTEDENTARNVWQWNKNGFGYSSTGIDGPYETAITADGAIVADYITSGNLNANVIKSGRIEGTNFYLDLDSGHAVFGEGSLSDEVKQSLKGEAGENGEDGNSFVFNMLTKAKYNTMNRDPWIGDSSTVVTMEDDYIDVSKSDTGNASLATLTYYKVLNFEFGKTYTLTALVKGGFYLRFKKTRINPSSTRYFYPDMFDRGYKTFSDWTLFSTTFRMSEEIGEDYYLSFIAQTKTNGQIKWMVISEGDKPVKEWMPSLDDLKGAKGDKGDKGDAGAPGTDATLPQWWHDWNRTTTTINSKYILTPNLYVGSDTKGVFMGNDVVNVNGTSLSGIIGYFKPDVLFHLYPGGLTIGNKPGRQFKVDGSGNVTCPTIRSDEIAAGAITTSKLSAGSVTADKLSVGAITTDMLIPGTNNRIVMERGYGPGSNDAMSLDANNGTIRLKYDARNYFAVNSEGPSLYNRNGMVMGTVSWGGIKVKEGRIFDLNNTSYNTVIRDALGFMVNCRDRMVFRVDETGGYANDWGSISDVRAKENICEVDRNEIKFKNESVETRNVQTNHVLDFIRNTKFYCYNYRSNGKAGFSTMAQSIKDPIKDILVHRVKHLEDTSEGVKEREYSTISLYPYISMIHCALQQEIKRNDELEDRIEDLEARLAILEAGR